MPTSGVKRDDKNGPSESGQHIPTMVPLLQTDSTGKTLANGGEDSLQKPEQVALKKELGLMDGVGICVGIIIGSGIFISPTGVIRYTGSVGLSLVVWVLSGIVSTIGALCYAELGTMIPKSGGDYAYINYAYGDFASFIYLWIALLIIIPSRGAVISLTFANYVLQPFMGNCNAPPDLSVKLVAIFIMVFLVWVNCTNVKAATKVQGIFTVAKIFALIVIIATGAVYMSMGHVENYENSFEGSNYGVGTIATAFYQGLFSYAGWNWLNFVVEELKNPYVNLPRAIMISLPLCTVVYTLTNVAYFSVLTPAEVLSSSAVAVTFGDRTLGVMSWIIPIFVACSTFGSLNGGLFAASRLFFVGARQGHLPAVLGLVNVNKHTPVPAICIMGTITCCMSLMSNVYALITYGLFADSLFILVSVTALLYLRYKEPNTFRPIKVWIGLPIIFCLICVGLVLLPILENPYEIACVVAIILSGVPVYILFIRSKSKSKIGQILQEKFLFFAQVLTRSLPVDKED